MGFWYTPVDCSVPISLLFLSTTTTTVLRQLATSCGCNGDQWLWMPLWYTGRTAAEERIRITVASERKCIMHKKHVPADLVLACKIVCLCRLRSEVKLHEPRPLLLQISESAISPARMRHCICAPCWATLINLKSLWTQQKNAMGETWEQGCGPGLYITNANHRKILHLITVLCIKR